MLANVMTKLVEDGFIVPFGLYARLRVLSGCDQRFRIQFRTGSNENFPTNCGLLSPSKWSGMPCDTIQFPTKICATSVAVVFLVGIALVSNEYLSVIAEMYLLPDSIFGKVTECSSRQISAIPPTETVVADVDASGIDDVFDTRGISYLNIDKICNMWFIVRQSHCVVYTFHSRIAGYHRVVFSFHHLFP